MKISGIYKIINKVNGKYYIGSSKDIKQRWHKHIYTLSLNKHKNNYLQRAWNKYGKDSFDWIVVEEVPIEKLLEVEQKYLDNTHLNNDICYNLNSKASGGGWNEVSKKKLSKKHKGKRNPFFGKKHSLKIKEMISKSSKERKHSLESKKKMSIIARKKGQSLKWKQKMKKFSVEYLISIKHPSVINIYKFININGKKFEGTSHEFKEKYKVKSHYIRGLIKKERKSIFGWSIQFVY